MMLADIGHALGYLTDMVRIMLRMMMMVMMITAVNLMSMVMSEPIARLVALQDLLFTQALLSICLLDRA